MAGIDIHLRNPRKFLLAGLLAGAFAVLTFSYFLFASDLALRASSFSPSRSYSQSNLPGSGLSHIAPFQISVKPDRLKITIILVWVDRGKSPPAYLPYFFESVEANPAVHLLFINVDKGNKGCTSHSTADNVRQVCLKEEECA